MFELEASFIDSKVKIRKSSIAGKGMFAKAPIKKDEVVFRWGGTFISAKEVKKAKASGKLLIQVDLDLWSCEDRDAPEDNTYFINHSCDSNLWMVDGRTFVAKRNINTGEEITVDYALFVSENYISGWNCHCGSKDCRNVITGKDYLIPSVKKRYDRHFSPVILAKLKAKGN